MSDDQIVARLRVIHEKFAKLFELARAAQRKPSRQEALLLREVVEVFGGEQGIVLRTSAFTSERQPEMQKYLPEAFADLAATVFGDEHVKVEVLLSEPEQNELTLRFALVDLDPASKANDVHRVTVFLTGLAKLNRYALHTYWSQHNPELAKKERDRVRLMFANALGIIGGMQQAMGPFGRFH